VNVTLRRAFSPRPSFATFPGAVRRPAGLFSALAFAAAFAGGCGGAMGEGTSADVGSSGPGLVGNPAPEFRVTALQGAAGPVSLAALRGQVVVLDFWGTYCGPCKASFPKLQGLNAKYGHSGLRILGISEDEADDKAKIAPFAAQYGAKFMIAWDQDRSIAQRYKPETMPSSFVIDRKGVIRYAHVGYRDGDDVRIEKEVQELLGL
jgi:cytochrome c biogenesis protein CcmG/thiol:disulfide interchange protein DsbE